MKDMLRFGIMVAGLLFCFGCVDSAAPSTEETEAENQRLHDSAEYQQQMMGEREPEALFPN